MNDWDINPERYETDDEGKFLLKKNGTPRKRRGRAKGSKSKGYNYHSATKARIKANQAIKAKEKLLSSAEAKVKRVRSSLKASKGVVSKIDSPNTSKVTLESDLENIPKALKEEASVIFKPNEGPQTEFLAAGETDVLYGGAAGGGKS